MDGWVWPAYIGVTVGLGLFAVVFVPTLFAQVRRYGSLSLPRLLGAGALAVYAVALGAYTMLPLPSGDLAAWCAQYGVSGAQLRPLQFVEDVRAGTAGMSPAAAATSTAVLQVVFNVLLFMPLGMFVRRLLGRGVIVAGLASACLSALIEVTQYTGAWGVIGCAYRVADIDDLLTNTLGGVLGALIAPLLLWWMPQTGELVRTRLTPRPVTVWRRWAAMAVDAAAFVVTGAVLVVCRCMVLLGAGAGEAATGDAASRPWIEWALGMVVPFVLVFCVAPVIGSGASWGQRAVWLVPLRPDGTAAPVALRCARAWSCGGLWALSLTVAAVPGLTPGRAAAAGVLAAVTAVVAVVSVPVTRDCRGLSCAVVGILVADSRGVAPPGEEQSSVGAEPSAEDRRSAGEPGTAEPR